MKVNTRALTSVLLVASIATGLAGVGVVIVRAQPGHTSVGPGDLFRTALARHEYDAAYRLTDLSYTTVDPSTSAITAAHFAAFERRHPTPDAPVRRGLVHLDTTTIALSAPDGPLPSLTVDGVRVPLRTPRRDGGGAGARLYRYDVLAISGAHRLEVGEGPVTVPTGLDVIARGATVTREIDLSASARGKERAVVALRAIVGTCPGDSCVVSPCTGSGAEYVLDAWGIGTPPIVARALVGARATAPMPAGGWSIAVTFVDQGQPPGLSGHEQTASFRARFVFGFVGGGRAALLDRCWVSHG